MKRKKNKNSVEYTWIVKIVLIAFAISIVFTFISETAIPNVNIIIGIMLCLLFIFIGILFDMVGVAVATADESILHSMSAQKINGAKVAVRLKKNADKVSSFCNDVVGDICGIVSGSTGAVIALRLTDILNFNSLIITILVMGIISALTIGGKALVKGIAMRKSSKILYKFATILNIFWRI